MIETTEQLKERRPDLVELFEGMSKEQLLGQVYKESIDAINMESRVGLLMSECTGLSYTTYPLETISKLVADYDSICISNFCQTALEDIEQMDVEEIKNYLREDIR